MLGVFYTLEQQSDWTSWAIHGWLFSVVSMCLALIGFAWVEPVAGGIMILIGSLLLTVPFLILYFIRRKLSTRSSWSFVILGLIWSPYTWFVKEKLVAFPITLFDISLSNYPVFIQFIDITGSTGVSTWVITLNVFLYVMIQSFHQHGIQSALKSVPIQKTLIGLLAWITLPIGYAWYSYSIIPNSYQGYVTAAVIQPGFPDHNLDPESDEAIMAGLEKSLALSDSAVAKANPDLLVWPESELPFSIRTDINGLQFISDRVLRWQTPLSTGISDLETTRTPIPPLQQYLNRDYYLYNAVAMITPQLAWKVLMEDEQASALKTYRKVNLMPFTEYVPFSDRFPELSRLAMEYGENLHLTPGESSAPLAFLTRSGQVVQSIPFICWDILFASTHRAENLQKAQLITAHTSGRLFGQDLKTSLLGIKNYTRLRSVEARKSIINSSTTGYSFFTNPFGEVLGIIDPFVSGFSIQEVPLHQKLTFYHRYPNFYPTLCIILIGLSIGFRKKLTPKTKN
jgi:apolipoprotein N-acyltransferase